MEESQIMNQLLLKIQTTLNELNLFDKLLTGDRSFFPIFDTREQASGFINFLHKYKLPFRVEQLLIADVAISQNKCLEIKRKVDPRSSLFDDRIHEQTQNMKENYAWYSIIFEDVQFEKGDQYFYPDKFLTMLDTLEVRMGAHCYFTRNFAETAKKIYEIWLSELKGEKKVTPENKTPRPNPNALRDNQIYLISSLLDTGYVKAKELLEYFGSPILIIKAIVQTEIKRSPRSGKPKIDFPVHGFGVKFILKNRKLLLGEI